MTDERDQLIAAVARAVPGCTPSLSGHWDLVHELGDRAVLIEDTVDDAGRTFVVTTIHIFGDQDWDLSADPKMASADDALALASAWLS
ncbi:Uncharacterised protein (plasmid) [Tsukamurella tyrosinosolvens]|uniref:Uncharacterized protein n=1 Tax=Tsukamurella tyrosinosolvens TaxID=57704 RepID=A0A1H4U6P4_TSUTY|nr:hypothetical protein [Tsukamurella tyrosinosolvens]KXO93012.1 hypothetical protein AXK58_14170 [Tsukamurella tyrosinosolvens]SEC64395.1 hypothetical protein SAMN04489793_2797 [Tsukamurella tyrosinosolvens]VEH94022.1 Uncharacterised protein [Tsukamurella tyrosinosolvens]